MNLVRCLLWRGRTIMLASKVYQDKLTDSTMETLRVSLLLRIPELSRSNVFIPNPELLCDKMRKISEEGTRNLQIVTDFDATLTKPTVDNKPAIGSLEVFKVMDIVPKEALEESRIRVLKFFKDVSDPQLTRQDKINMADILLKGLAERITVLPIPDDSPFQQEAAKGIFALREGTSAVFKLLEESSVPVLVLSGGLTCIINYTLKEEHLLTSNVHVMANSYKYKDGHIESFDGGIIHYFNKNIFYLESELYKKELSKRRNIIVIGDAVSDCTMVDGVPSSFNILKIGFCHKNLFGHGHEEYIKHFDIVVTEDETFNLVNAVLKYILSSS